MKIWTLTVVKPEWPSPAVLTPTVTVHDTEQEGLDHLEEEYGDAVERDSDLYSDLQNWGYYINLDVHEF